MFKCKMNLCVINPPTPGVCSCTVLAFKTVLCEDINIFVFLKLQVDITLLYEGNWAGMLWLHFSEKPYGEIMGFI